MGGHRKNSGSSTRTQLSWIWPKLDTVGWQSTQGLSPDSDLSFAKSGPSSSFVSPQQCRDSNWALRPLGVERASNWERPVSADWGEGPLEGVHISPLWGRDPKGVSIGALSLSLSLKGQCMCVY